MIQVRNRREENREATLREIGDCARALLVSEGPQGVTLRSIARAVGLTAPGLYRYFPSRMHLLQDLNATLYAELAETVEGARDAVDRDDVGGRLMAVTNAFRQWSTAHPPEFGFVFATPVGSIDPDEDERLKRAVDRFAGVFFGLFVDLWFRRGFPVPDAADMAPDMVEQLERWVARDEIPLPLPAVQVFLECWVQIYGLISMEVFGHLAFAIADVNPMFDAMLVQLGDRLALGDLALGDLGSDENPSLPNVAVAPRIGNQPGRIHPASQVAR
jgi:AcrR family transcriptional regulator